ncbi:MAG: peptide/nickel transport system ATP-binding protein [Rhodospirillaceae bacterium]|nr:peptide/nickel transport system ATP-binding protein [Rhodospirillaceae bacterium]
MIPRTLLIENLNVAYRTDSGPLRALRDVSLDIRPGEIVGLVGESGCGKSSLIQAILRLMPANAEITGGRIALEGVDLLQLNSQAMRRLRGDRLSVVFQDPMTALNPVLSIGRQMIDIQYRRTDSRAAKRRRAIDMLKRVRIADPERRFDRYPHEFSGGMRQRVAIAMALMAEPALLIADEPTTALDATLEIATIELLKKLQREIGCAILFVSHHLGVIAELCDRVNVMYAGEVVESGGVRSVFRAPQHPYTQRLLACDPARVAERSRRLPTIPGDLPDLVTLPPGCVFAARCPAVFGPCRKAPPPFVQTEERRNVRCYLAVDEPPP